MDLATSTLRGAYSTNSLGFSRGSETAVQPRSQTGSSRTRPSRPTATAYLPHKSLHATGDHHAVLGVSRFATKQEIKKSYRRLALELHPDVCSGDLCTTRFLQVKKAYEALIQETTSQFGEFEDDVSDNLESFMGVGDNDWEEWEEWMGWEGAGTYDYTNHINPSLD